MNDHVYQAQFTLRLLLGEQQWILEVYQQDSAEGRYVLEANHNENVQLRFEMTRTSIGKWIVVGDVPQVIQDYAQEIGKSLVQEGG